MTKSLCRSLFFISIFSFSLPSWSETRTLASCGNYALESNGKSISLDYDPSGSSGCCGSTSLFSGEIIEAKENEIVFRLSLPKTCWGRDHDLCREAVSRVFIWRSIDSPKTLMNQIRSTYGLAPIPEFTTCYNAGNDGRFPNAVGMKSHKRSKKNKSP